MSYGHQKTNKRPKIRLWIGLILLLLLIILLRQCTHHSKQHELSNLNVVTAVAESRNIPVYLSAIGNVIPISTVTVKSQVSGQLLRVLYHEGQMVKAGELLAEIDPRPYQAQLLQYEGQLARDKALLANALIDLKRYQTLWRQDSTSKQILDTQASLVKQYEGSIKADEGLVQSTKVNLIYTKIIAPIDGRIGLRLVDPGNFVQAMDTTGLAVITSLDPITVQFALPEDDIPKILKQIQPGHPSLPVNVYDRNQETLLAKGNLITIDNQIDPTTGTVRLKAVFSNLGYKLFPSQFVNAQLLINTLKNATVVPTAAIQYGPKENFVYLLNPDETVSVKPVVIELSKDDITVIASGIIPGQSVVVEGVDKLTDGAKVNIDNPVSQPISTTPPTNKGDKHKHKTA